MPYLARYCIRITLLCIIKYNHTARFMIPYHYSVHSTVNTVIQSTVRLITVGNYERAVDEFAEV